MEIKEFERKDGTTGQNYIAEVGDEFISNFSTVRVNTNGAYENYSLGVKNGDVDIYLKLTAGQHKSLIKFGDLTGKKISFYSYKNDFGDQVGAKAE